MPGGSEENRSRVILEEPERPIGAGDGFFAVLHVLQAPAAPGKLARAPDAEDHRCLLEGKPAVRIDDHSLDGAAGGQADLELPRAAGGSGGDLLEPLGQMP